MKLAILLLGAALAITAAAAYAGLSPERGTVTVPALLETTGIGGSVVAPSGLIVSPAAVAFGGVRPGTTSEVVELSIYNGGSLPFAVSVTTLPFTHPSTGATLPVDALTFTRSQAGSLLPGGSLTLAFELHVPSGAEQWVPPGAYAGAIQLHYQEAGL